MKALKRIFASIVYVIIIIIPFIHATSLYGKHYLYKQVQLNKGLPSTLNCIFSDTKGFIWTGTRFGLGRFDGHEQKRYLHQHNDSTSLPGNYIYQIVEDSHQQLWILTEKGAVIYDYRNNHFIPVKEENGNECIAFSACKWGNSLLLGGINKVYSYNPQTGELKTFYELHHKQRFEIIRLAISKEQNLLCCSRWEGIYAINLRNGQINASPFQCGKEISDMFIDSRQRIWIAPYNEGIQCFNPKGEKIASYTTQNSNLSNDIVLCITEKEGQLWLGTDGGGINILDVDNNRFTHLKHVPGDKLYSLSTNSINCIYRDSYNNIWMGGVYNGLISIREVAMKTYTDVPFGNSLGLSHNIVISLHKENPNRIWIGTDGQGVYLYSNPLYSIKSVVLSNLYRKAVTPVRALHIDDERTLWIGTKGNGIIKAYNYDAKKEIFDCKTEMLTISNSDIGSNAVYCFSKSKHNLLWIGNEEGLCYYSYKDKRIRRLPVIINGKHLKYID